MSKRKLYPLQRSFCARGWMTARSACGLSSGIRPSRGGGMNMAATPLRTPPPAACIGQKRNSPGSGRRNSRSSRRRAALLLPMPQSKSLLLSREKIPLLPGRSRRALRSVDGSRRARTLRKRLPRSRQKILISAHRQRHRSQWQRNRSGRGREYSWRNAGAKLPDGRQSKSEPYRAAESRRHKPYIQTGTVAPCRTECVRSRYRTSKNGLKPACPNQRGKSTCRWGVTSSLFRRVLRR